MLTDLQQRGVLIACINNFKDFSEAITSVFPQTEPTELHCVHQICNSLNYVASKDQREFIKDPKPVYRAENKDLTELRLLELEEKRERSSLRCSIAGIAIGRSSQGTSITQSRQGGSSTRTRLQKVFIGKSGR